ncbi:MAG: CBS domain-containing protein [Hydrogenophilus sp.]|nr:CBS domain-containing protein [Hydrogenophilus sp.]
MAVSPLKTITVTSKPHLSRPALSVTPTTPQSPAIDVMTDFMRVPPVVAAPNESAAEAEQRMIRRGVRSVLVVDDQDQIVGLLTAADTMGEKPLQTADRLGISPKELRVVDLMTPIEQLDALSFDQVARATVAEIVATLQHIGRQHALVLDTAQREPIVRGIFSATQIARQLGTEIAVHTTARTFAEIEAYLK